jgi:hypothetical protein
VVFPEVAVPQGAFGNFLPVTFRLEFLLRVWCAFLVRGAGCADKSVRATRQQELMACKTHIFAWIALAVLAPAIWPSAAFAQDEEQPLGDLARNLRRDKAQQQASAPAPPPVRTVVDNDNLTQVMEDAAKLKPVAQDKTVLSLNSSGNMLTVSSPDVTCSMSFNARASSLIVKPVLVEDLPPEELAKLDGPASIHDDNLQLDVFNGTEWALREITVGLTMERRPGEDAETAALARVLPVVEGGTQSIGTQAVVERHSDVTLLFHLKTETKAFDRAALREYVGVTPGPDEEWRWSIVEAKGIRPEGSRVGPESLTEPLFGAKTAVVPATNLPANVSPSASPNVSPNSPANSPPPKTQTH